MLDKDLNKLNVTIVPEQVTVKVEIAEYSKEVQLYLNHEGFHVQVSLMILLRLRKKRSHYSVHVKCWIRLKNSVVDVDVSEVKGQGTLEIDLKKPKGVSKMSLDKIKVKVRCNSVRGTELEVTSDPRDYRYEEDKEQVTYKRI